MSICPPLSYLSEQDREWATALRGADSLAKLKELCRAWGAWVPDALAIAEAMDENSFTAFRTGLLKKTSDLAWAGRFGSIAVPARLLEISMMALQFKAPFGTAAIRHAELGGKKTAWLKRVPR